MEPVAGNLQAFKPVWSSARDKFAGSDVLLVEEDFAMATTALICLACSLFDISVASNVINEAKKEENLIRERKLFVYVS